ncbi:hypothetical protein TNCV_618011 [Trichonephila clavipes]|nr:hypothetical protein TNCV_618011 [Trichonephila clavipes]
MKRKNLNSVGISKVINKEPEHDSNEYPKRRAVNSIIISEIESRTRIKISLSNASLVKYSRGHSKKTNIMKPIPPRLL